MSTKSEFAQTPGLKTFLGYWWENLIWFSKQIPVLSFDRYFAIMFGGIAIALSFATLLIAFSTGSRDFQAIAGLGAVLVTYICMEQIYDRQTYFVFVGCIGVAMVAAFTISAIAAGIPQEQILGVTLATVLPYILALLIVMGVGDFTVKSILRVFRASLGEK